MKRFLSLILLSALLLTGCARESQRTHFAMNTVMFFSAWGRDGEKAIDLAVETVNALERDLSATDGRSLLPSIDQGGDIPEEYKDLFARVEALSERTGGAFDPKLHALSQAWGFYNEEHRVPTQEEIDQALKTPQWDLGGALKGYAGTLLAEKFSQLQVDRALINLGGNVQTYGRKADGTPWQIGIQDPDGDGNLCVLELEGTMAAVTSGDYQRYFEVDGVRYHHILDPKTGYPADSGLRSVTVVSSDGLTADCLSTALFVMGLERGTEFWRESGDFEAVFLTSEGNLYATEGVTLTGCAYEILTR